MIEGTNDPKILEKVQSYINPAILLKRLHYIYRNIIRETRVNVLESILKLINKLNNKN